MALDGTITKVSAQDIGDGELLVVDVQGPTEYDQAAGGESLAGNPFGLRIGSRYDAVGGMSALTAAAGYAKLNASSGLLQFFTTADAEVADDVDLSAFIYRLTVQGR